MDMSIKRLGHLGIVAGVIKDLGLINEIDKRLQTDQNGQEAITPGEAIAGMMINGLRFSSKPLSLTPHFFATKALEVLFRPGVDASHFNRYKLGKVLDKAFHYGCESLFFELALHSCAHEHIDMRFNSLDTTTFALTGDYAQDVGEHTIHMKHGYSKDHRPDLKQVVHELLVSQDGGVPLMMKPWDGHASDNKIFKERAQALIEHFKQSKLPRYLIAGSKLYSKDHAAYLSALDFITRIPATLHKERKTIMEAIQADQWEKPDKDNQYDTKILKHYGIEQRWLVVYSDIARERALKTLNKSVKKESEQLEKQLWHLSKRPFSCASDAEKAADELLKPCHYHQVDRKSIAKQCNYTAPGRPHQHAEPTSVAYFITVTVTEDKDKIFATLHEKSCYVIGTNIAEEKLSSPEIIAAYKRQHSSIENMGFRFLKDPVFFASSLFLKKPSRIMGLLMVMTLSLLVYAIAQRRIRLALEHHNETIPNQIQQPTQTPTMRWIFQLMDGIHVVTIHAGGVIKKIVEGLTDMKRKIINLMGEAVLSIYYTAGNANLSMGG